MASYRKRGSVWHVQIRRKGHPSLTKTFISKADADRWVRRIERGIDLGEGFIHAGVTQATLLCELLERYRDTVSIHKLSHDVEKWRLNAMSRHWLGKCSLERLSSEIISKYRNERMDMVCGASVLMELNLLRHCLKIAINEWGAALSINLVDGVRFPSPSKPRKRRLEAGEFDFLIQGCKLGRSPLLAPVIIIAIETGMRRGERRKW